MLKTIVQQSQSPVAFISALNLALYQPQKRHLIQLLDALLGSQGRKTLSYLYRLWIGKLDPKTADASAKLINFCRRQRRHVICAVKSNRRIDHKR